MSKSTIALSSIKPLARNPRTISPAAMEKLKESITRDGEAFMVLRPIIVDEKDSVILGGNMRHKACVELGMKEVPASWVRFGKFTKEQRRRFILVDNAPEGMSGDFDLTVLQADWALPELGELGFDLSLLTGPTAPGEFPVADENIETEHICPKCSYKWSGKAA